MVDREEKQALNQISQNNTVGLRFIFNKYHQSLCEFATIYVQRSDIACDLVSEFFIKFWNQRHQIHITGSLKSYLFKSIKNASLNQLRGKKMEMMNYEDYTEVFVSTDLSPSEQIEFKEFQDKLDILTNSLPARRKIILQLKVKSGLSNAEIAETLQLSESTVKNQLRTAFLSFKEKI
jgi:RNA polymerase sigma-70 factor (ECF subfamily)